MNIKTIVFWVLSFIFVACSALATTVSDVRLSTFSNGTGRVVVESDAKLNSKIFTLENPNRLVLDMAKSVIKSHVRKKEFKKKREENYIRRTQNNKTGDQRLPVFIVFLRKKS